MTNVNQPAFGLFGVFSGLQSAVVSPLLFIAALILHSTAVAIDNVAISWQGSWQQGSLLLGRVPQEYRVRYGGVDLPIASNGEFLLGLSRDAEEQIALEVLAPGQAPRTLKFDVASRSYDIQRIEGVPSDRVIPPESVLARIRSEAGEVVRARSLRDDSEVFLAGFKAPMQRPLTGVYGSQRVYNGVPKNPHYGVDYAAPTGAKVLAPASGVVTLAHDDMFYSGGTLIVDHGHGLSSSFLHLSKILVAPGDVITRGQEVAEVGASGRATGPHLDWRMNWGDVRIDPLLVLQALPALDE